ncbi:MAG: DUF4835 family protein [Flavobacteriaceae bacterium]|nr:DUF4835 family protein [Flavobacteriaceae bacterium]
MHKILLFILFSCFSFAQVLDCKVSINADLVDQTNSQIFETLERELNEFVNATSWVDIRSEDYNKINCTMLITIENYGNNEFQANLQIQSSRPVFGSAYVTPLLNRKDDDFNFSYQEFESLNFNPNNTNTSLVSLISYYVFVVLGVDADSFSLFGGDPYYEQARKIVDLSQANRFSGWKQSEKKTNRYWLIDQLSTNPFSLFRKVIYDYHLNGLDVMVNQPEVGKQTISKSISDLKSLSKSRPNSLVVQLFFDTKSDEVVQIFSGGPSFDTSQLREDLNRVAPFFSAKWAEIR